MMNHAHPERTRLCHAIPSWTRDDSVFFITVCCNPRGQNQLCHDGTAAGVFESIAFRNAAGIWHLRLCVLMPDHLHALISFPHDTSMRPILSMWKEWLAKRCGIKWQRDFFDHRLRNDENWREKADYLRANPVRKGLVATPDEWRYVWAEDVRD